MEQESTYWQSLDSVTQTAAGHDRSSLRVPGLTLLGHPDSRRIGERAVLTALASWREVSLSRLEPLFSAPGETLRRPLGDRFLSRSPIRLIPAADGVVRLDARASKIRVAVDGRTVRARRDFSAAQIEHGVVLLLADRVTLLLHALDPLPPPDLPRFALVGDSTGIVTVRQQVAGVADLQVPILLRGETGTGKELVASAIHEASSRRTRPFVPVNMGAIPPTLAAAELFGAAKGAFTGADRQRAGFFVRSEGGTLFLDEIGETPPEVQVLLLRTLETGIVEAVGSEKSRKVDVRIVAATDAHLESEIEAGCFRAPLLHRLSGFEIRLPPLRERRDDIGRLLVHFLRKELLTLGEIWRLEDRDSEEKPWLAASTVARLAAYDWPGNVRQLRNVARQLVIANRGAEQLRITPQIEELLDGPAKPSTPSPQITLTEKPHVIHPLAAVAGDKPVIKTLLVTDLVESTRMVEVLGDRRSAEVMARHDRAARQILPEYDGHEIDKSDGFLLLFDRPTDAVGYALEYHEMLETLGGELGLTIEARAGIHLGEVFLRRNAPAEVARGAKALEVEGLAKPMAARLMSLAEGRQTLLTRNAFDLARQTARGEHPLAVSEIAWLGHGMYHFKGLPEPIEVFEIGMEGRAPLKPPTGSGKAGEKVGADRPAPPVASEMAEREKDPETEETGKTPVIDRRSMAGSRKNYRSPDDVSEDELLEALRAHRFRLQPAAATLGVSRTSLYALIDKSSRIRKARDLRKEEIERSRKRHRGDLDAMAAELEVSRKGLSRRMTELGLVF